MADRRNVRAVAAHAAHDRELVARAAAGDLDAAEVTTAEALVAQCPDCAALAADLRALAAAVQELGSDPSRKPVRAPRDFRLTDADATRLRRRGVPGLAAAGEAVRRRGRALGGALAALGIAGILLATGMPGLLGAAGGAAPLELAGAPTKEGASLAPNLAPSTTDVDLPAASPDRMRSTPGWDGGTSSGSGQALLAVGSVIALGVGLWLLLVAQRGRSGSP